LDLLPELNCPELWRRGVTLPNFEPETALNPTERHKPVRHINAHRLPSSV
jgi:hypothetical protein